MATPLPPTSDFTHADTTEAGFKVAFANMRAFLAGLLGSSGAAKDARKTLGAVGNEVVYKSAAYTLTVDDCGKTFVWLGSTALTASFAAATALGNGWTAELVNMMSENLTLDPDSSEQIDGAATLVLPPGGRAMIRCDGAGLIIVAKIDNSQVASFNTRTGAVTLTSGDVTTALGFTPATAGHGHGGVYVQVDSHSRQIGSYGLGSASSGIPAENATFAGSGYGLGAGNWRRAYGVLVVNHTNSNGSFLAQRYA